jgi:hypothetical protein
MATLHRPPTRRLATAAALVLGAVVLGLVFALYSRPDFMVHMANQLWACF